MQQFPVLHILLSLSAANLCMQASSVQAAPQGCLRNILVQIGEISAEQAPTCFVSSQCIKESETQTSVYKNCFANFRYDSNGWLLFELGRTINSYSPHSSTEPPYIKFKWGEDKIVEREQTLALDCHGKKMWSYLHSSALPLAPWQSSICVYFLDAHSIASSSTAVESSRVISAIPTNEPNRPKQLLHPKPQLYETLSSTPFYWKRY